VAIENHRMNISPHTSKFNFSKFIHQLISLPFHINFATKDIYRVSFKNTRNPQYHQVSVRENSGNIDMK
jgi:hypothetical protein